jgi:hypothetical protein
MTVVPSEIDPRVVEFLASHAPGPAGPGGLTPLAGDASTRRYFRLERDGGSVVLALYPEPFDAATLPFAVVRSLLAGWGLPVPAILDADGPRGILLLEDLGDETLQRHLATAGAEQRVALYREAIDQLLRLQAQAAGGPRDAVCFTLAFDAEKLRWELHFFETHFLEGLRGAALSADDKNTLAESFEALATEIASWPRVLCHRDFHSRNLMRHRGCSYWIDFQDARLGPASYDLASLLRDSYVDLGEEFVADRAEEFRQRSGEARDIFARRFELMSVQRNLKALGTFGYMTAVRGSDAYRGDVPRTLGHARRNLARHPELAALRRVLARHLEELQ